MRLTPKMLVYHREKRRNQTSLATLLKVSMKRKRERARAIERRAARKILQEAKSCK
jgi:hypothetical protein